ncbi:PilZ domain-containing protein [Cellvibrio japonicus]|uniref:PilZ domain-containing protein n=1 Tax=Cellvibrio japonicus (strain Ueda107) TaxID=498211 RepID=B3PFR1_CELJU|nr:PilZ domain-containing protein [Cellvibrio japonicus]ACE83634.1 conserved hypothetical protein [Cellvibrio japonicus Ueda107]QEI12285.1 PilZ domain-containing protein [Cellvibrio japonicus]QEI15859.1 PilZ domain-containing protein [Cellvibrio japonicus]QEI19437.1 PilZ domain-containing protein [Cellvibrio japonicus]
MSERRSYFRIDESIALEYRVVPEVTANTAAPELQFPNTASLKLYAELRKIDTENSLLFHQIRESNRAVAEYLQNLNRKIELISQQMLIEHKPPPPSKTIKIVNLSEGGIAFGSSQALAIESYVAMRLVFLPSNAGLVVFAKIIRCEPSNTGEYQIAAKFHRINDTQQHLIGQQIMRAQMAEKRRSKQVLQ